MPIRIFTIPFDPNSDIFQDEELAKFLLNKKIKTLKPKFFQQYGTSYWTVFGTASTGINSRAIFFRPYGT